MYPFSVVVSKRYQALAAIGVFYFEKDVRKRYLLQRENADCWKEYVSVDFCGAFFCLVIRSVLVLLLQVYLIFS